MDIVEAVIKGGTAIFLVIVFAWIIVVFLGAI